MYYTDINNYEQLLEHDEEHSYGTDIVVTIIFGLITLALVQVNR